MCEGWCVLALLSKWGSTLVSDFKSEDILPGSHFFKVTRRRTKFCRIKVGIKVRLTVGVEVRHEAVVVKAAVYSNSFFQMVKQRLCPFQRVSFQTSEMEGAASDDFCNSRNPTLTRCFFVLYTTKRLMLSPYFNDSRRLTPPQTVSPQRQSGFALFCAY